MCPFLRVPNIKFGQARMEQLLLKKYLQLYSKCTLHNRVPFLSSVYINFKSSEGESIQKNWDSYMINYQQKFDEYDIKINK